MGAKRCSRFVALLVGTFAALAVFPFQSFAVAPETFTSGGVTYLITSASSVQVGVGSRSAIATSAIGVTLPTQVTNGTTYTVTAIGSYAFADCSALASITIPDGVCSLGNDAFSGCSSLTSLSIPDSVVSIGASAFQSCSSLASATIPARVGTIDRGTFLGCTSLVSVCLPDSITSIGSYAFYGCASLTSIVVPPSVDSIGSSAFEGCTSLVLDPLSHPPLQLGSSAFEGVRWSFANASIQGISDQYTYGGWAICPRPTFVVVDGCVPGYPQLGGDTYVSVFETSYLNNIDAGSATVRVTGLYPFSGSADRGFTISPANLAGWTAGFTVNGYDLEYVYSGAQIAPVPVVSFNGATLVEGRDYTVGYGPNTSPGRGFLYVSGVGNFTGMWTAVFEINPRDIGQVDVSGIDPAYVYCGKAITPVPSLTVDGVSMKDGIDYDVYYLGNVDAGVAKVIMSGLGSPVGSAGCVNSREQTFTIVPANIASATLSGLETSYPYSPDPIEPLPEVTQFGRALTAGVDYTISYQGNDAPGTAVVTITGIGNFVGVKSASFVIQDRPAVTCTYEAGLGGSIAGVSSQTVAYGADCSTVTALPQAGYRFVSWSDGVKTAERCDRNVTSSRVIMAQFVRVYSTRLSLSGPSSVYRSRTFKLSGSIAPSSASGNVSLIVKRYYSGAWHKVGATKYRSLSAGRFAYSFAPNYRGRWRIYASYAGRSTATGVFTAAPTVHRDFIVK